MRHPATVMPLAMSAIGMPRAPGTPGGVPGRGRRPSDMPPDSLAEAGSQNEAPVARAAVGVRSPLRTPGRGLGASG